MANKQRISAFVWILSDSLLRTRCCMFVYVRWINVCMWKTKKFWTCFKRNLLLFRLVFLTARCERTNTLYFCLKEFSFCKSSLSLAICQCETTISLLVSRLCDCRTWLRHSYVIILHSCWQLRVVASTTTASGAHSGSISSQQHSMTDVTPCHYALVHCKIVHSYCALEMFSYNCHT